MNVYEGKSKWYTIRAKTWSSVHTWQSGQKLPFFFWTEHIPHRGVSLTYWLTSDRPQLEHFMHLPHSCWWKSKESLRKCLFVILFPLHVSGYFVSIFSTYTFGWLTHLLPLAMASFLWASCMHSWWKTFLQVAHLAVSSAELSGPPQTRQRVHFRQVQLSNEAEEEIKTRVNNDAKPI